MTKQKSSRLRLAASALLTLWLATACGQADDASVGPDISDGGTGGSGGNTGGIEGGSGGATTAGSGGSAGSGGGGGSYQGANFVAQPVTYLVNTSQEPIRVCLQEVDGDYLTFYPLPNDKENPMPQTNYPGVPVGGAVPFDDGWQLITQNERFTLHVVPASRAGVPEGTCEGLLDPDQGIGDHPVLADIDRASLMDLAQSVRVLVLDDSELKVVELDPERMEEPTGTYAFAAHQSPSLEALRQGAAKIELQYGNLADASGRISMQEDVGDLVSKEAPEFIPPDKIEEYGTTGFIVTAKQEGADDVLLLNASLANVQRVSSPYDTPDVFFDGPKGMLLLLVGDTGAEQKWVLEDASWNPGYDGKGLHILALPFLYVPPSP